MNSKALKKLLPFIIVVWLIGIAFSYFYSVNYNPAKSGRAINKYSVSVRQSHQYYLDSLKSVIATEKVKAKDGQEKDVITLSPFLYISIIMFCLYGLFRIYKNHSGKKEMNLTPFSLTLVSCAGFFLLYFLWIRYFEMNSPVTYENIFSKFFKSISEILLIFLPVLSLGRKINGIFFKRVEGDGLSNFLFSAGMGIFAFSYLYYFLALFGGLNRLNLIISFSIVVLFSINEFLYWIKSFFTSRIEIKIEDDFSLALIVIFFIVLAQNLVELIRPLPIGHDDLELYMNTINLIAQSGKLVNGIHPYPWELFVSGGAILFKNTVTTLILSSMSSVFAFLSLFKIALFYCKKRNLIFRNETLFFPLLAATLFFTLPSVIFQSAADMKVDLIAFFYAVLSLLLFFLWQENPIKKTYLLLAVLFTGFAFTIKLTSLFFVLTMFAYLIFSFIKFRVPFKKTASLIFVLFFVFLIPLLPYVVRNVFQTKKITPVGLILLGKEKSVPIIKLNKNDPDEDPFKSIKNNAKIISLGSDTAKNGKLELSRYMGGRKSLSNYLSLPFSETLNSNISGQYVDIGFLFLAFTPLLIIFFSKIKKNNRNLNIFYGILVFGVIYWLLWTAFAQGVIWYGLIGFSFLMFLLIEIFSAIFSQRRWALSAISGFSIIVWFASTLVLHLSYLPDIAESVRPISLAYAQGSMSADECISKYIGGYEIIKKINQEIESSKNPPKIYVVGKYVSYFIERNNELVISDQLQTFALIHYDNDDQATLRRLKDSGFKYIIISHSQGFTSGEFEVQFNRSMADLFNMFKNNPENFKALTDPEKDRALVVEIM